jgi:hypothetical protein
MGRWLAVALIAACTRTAPRPAEKSPLEKLLDQADRDAQTNHDQEAERRWREALAIDPRSTRALENLAGSLASRACRSEPPNGPLLDEAAEVATRWRAIDPGCEPRALLLIIYSHRDPDGKALPLVKETLATCKADYRVGRWLEQLGRIELADGDRAAAERDLCASVASGQISYAADRCLELRARRVAGSIEKYDPGDDWLGQYLLGLYGPGSLDHLERSAKLNPKFRRTFDHLARVYQDKGDKPGACAALDRWGKLGDEEASSPYDHAFVDGEYRARKEAMSCD